MSIRLVCSYAWCFHLDMERQDCRGAKAGCVHNSPLGFRRSGHLSPCLFCLCQFLGEFSGPTREETSSTFSTTTSPARKGRKTTGSEMRKSKSQRRPCITSKAILFVGQSNLGRASLLNLAIGEAVSFLSPLSATSPLARCPTWPRRSGGGVTKTTLQRSQSATLEHPHEVERTLLEQETYRINQKIWHRCCLLVCMLGVAFFLWPLLLVAAGAPGASAYDHLLSRLPQPAARATFQSSCTVLQEHREPRGRVRHLQRSAVSICKAGVMRGLGFRV